MLRALLLAALVFAFSPLASQAQTGHWPIDRVRIDHDGHRYGGQRYGDPGRQREANRGDRDRRNAMSPDERRELNRDLQRANQEFYRKGRERQQRR